jgi:hypothetical protein
MVLGVTNQGSSRVDKDESGKVEQHITLLPNKGKDASLKGMRDGLSGIATYPVPLGRELAEHALSVAASCGVGLTNTGERTANPSSEGQFFTEKISHS